jgi:hypothetical protein
MAVGQTDELDGRLAAEELLVQCLASMNGSEPQAAVLLASHDVDVEDLLKEISTLRPNMGLIGCTTMAVMSSSANFVEGSTSLTVFASDEIDFTVGLGIGISADVDGAVGTAVREASGQTDKDPALMIVTPSVEGLDPANIAQRIGAVLGESVPIVGGGAAPDFPMVTPWLGGKQFYGDQVLTDSLPVLLVSGPLKVSVGVAHGWNPVGKTATVTKAEEHKVYEIDGQPILEFYQRYYGAGTQPAFAHPLALVDERTGEHVLRAALQYDESDGSVAFFGSVPEGSTVQFAMASTDEILRGTEAAVQEALATFPSGDLPQAAFVASCSVRSFLLGSRTRDEIERIRAGLGNELPVSGFYGFGEIAPLEAGASPSFHNETCVTVLLGS